MNYRTADSGEHQGYTTECAPFGKEILAGKKLFAVAWIFSF